MHDKESSKMPAKSKPVEMSPEEKLAARRAMLELWRGHSDLIGMEITVVGIVPNSDPGAAHKMARVDLGQLTATLNKKDEKNFNFHAGGKLQDPTEPGLATENVFQVGVNATAIKSREW